MKLRATLLIVICLLWMGLWGCSEPAAAPAGSSVAPPSPAPAARRPEPSPPVSSAAPLPGQETLPSGISIHAWLKTSGSDAIRECVGRYFSKRDPQWRAEIFEETERDGFLFVPVSLSEADSEMAYLYLFVFDGAGEYVASSTINTPDSFNVDSVMNQSFFGGYYCYYIYLPDEDGPVSLLYDGGGTVQLPLPQSKLLCTVDSRALKMYKTGAVSQPSQDDGAAAAAEQEWNDLILFRPLVDAGLAPPVERSSGVLFENAPQLRIFVGEKDVDGTDEALREADTADAFLYSYESGRGSVHSPGDDGPLPEDPVFEVLEGLRGKKAVLSLSVSGGIDGFTLYDYYSGEKIPLAPAAEMPKNGLLDSFTLPKRIGRYVYEAEFVLPEANGIFLFIIDVVESLN